MALVLGATASALASAASVALLVSAGCSAWAFVTGPLAAPLVTAGSSSACLLIDAPVFALSVAVAGFSARGASGVSVSEDTAGSTSSSNAFATRPSATLAAVTAWSVMISESGSIAMWPLNPS